MALPFVPIGIPPGPGISTEYIFIYVLISTFISTSGFLTLTFICGNAFKITSPSSALMLSDVPGKLLSALLVSTLKVKFLSGYTASTYSTTFTFRFS